MTKHRFILSCALILMLAFSSCGDNNKPTYIRITSEEAMAMNPLYLDVRTQEEYDEGHIPNAILLPESEISEKAENVLPDINKVIFVYCRTGIRSERAANLLIAMGYTKVYDLGGIVDWTGEIVNFTGYTHFNYFGDSSCGELIPHTTSVPFSSTTFEYIGSGLCFWFTTEGEIFSEYRVDYRDNSKYSADREYTRTSTLTITGENGYKQVFSDLETDSPFGGGISFADWNFDGYLDISLFQGVGGTARNVPAYYWLWDNDAHEFVRSDELERLNNVEIIEETQQIKEYEVNGNFSVQTWYHEYKNGVLTMVKSVEVVHKTGDEVRDDEILKYLAVELGDGEMIITDESFEIIRYGG